MMPANQPDHLLTTRQHFDILDGLRGVAAVAVVFFHFMEIAVPDPAQNIVTHTYLAVDFFFCLSGFVIAYAYSSRLQQIGVATFLKLRLIRLHPLVIIGSVLGLLTFVFDPFSNLQQVYGAGQTLLLFITSCFMIPYPIVHERYANLFHLNAPSWSLFWEYIANIFYALVLVKLRDKALWLLTALAAAALCYEAYRSGYLGVGWGGDNVTGGANRVAFSFLAGIMVYRSGWIIRSRLGFIPLTLLLLAAFVVPYADKFNPFTDTLLIVFYFPLLVALGAGAQLSPRLTRLCKFSGNISYPLYMTHYPFIWLYFSYLQAKKPTPAQLQVIIPVAVVLLVVLAYLILVFVDAPIRRYLKNRMRAKAA